MSTYLESDVVWKYAIQARVKDPCQRANKDLWFVVVFYLLCMHIAQLSDVSLFIAVDHTPRNSEIKKVRGDPIRQSAR